jgi:pimeloyl-ACP methyl ester carboxylesterase
VTHVTHTEGTHAVSTTVRTTTSKDGTHISYQTVGMGEGLIIIPGALSVAEDYVPLAKALSDVFTVHIIERRGRGQSGAMGVDYSIIKECEDVAAIQKETDAHFLFGHSYGGLIALEAARKNDALTKIAVYEPGVSINHSIATDWIPAYEAHLARGKPLDAFIEFIRGSGPAFMKWLPNWWLRLILPRVIHGAEWDKIIALLPSNVIEHKEVKRLNNTTHNYREICAEALLMSGGKSPAFREQTLQALASVLSTSKIAVLPKLDHFGPTRGAPSVVADAIKAYFLT